MLRQLFESHALVRIEVVEDACQSLAQDLPRLRVASAPHVAGEVDPRVVVENVRHLVR